MKNYVLGHLFQTLSFTQSRAKRVETVLRLLKSFFSASDIFVFFPPISMLLRLQNLLDNLTHSTLKRGRGELIGFNAISLKTMEKAQIKANY